MSLPLQGLHFKPQFKILLSKLRGCRRTWPPAHARSGARRIPKPLSAPQASPAFTLWRLLLLGALNLRGDGSKCARVYFSHF